MQTQNALMSPETKAKVISVLKGAAIAGVGAVLTYGSEFVATGGFSGFGPFAPIAVVGFSVLVNSFRKWAEK